MHRTSSTLKLGTRASILAVWQAEKVSKLLQAAQPNMRIEIVKIGTSGDAYQKGSLADIGGKGLFAKEIDQALINQDIDFAVHSLKDLETTLPQGIALAAVLARDDARDAMIGAQLEDLPKGARVASCSVRRAAQVQMLRPDVHIVPIRGNVQTRLAKLQAGAAEATLLSFAGLQRLGLEAEAAEILTLDRMIPAAGQGVIAVCVREVDTALQDMIMALNHAETSLCTTAERALLAVLDGSCHTPIGAHATFVGDEMHMTSILLSLEGQQHFRQRAQARVTDHEEAHSFGREVARVIVREAGDILASTRA